MQQQKHQDVEQNDTQYNYLKQRLHEKAVADVSTILPSEKQVIAKPRCSPIVSPLNRRPVSQAERNIAQLQAMLWSGIYRNSNTVIVV